MGGWGWAAEISEPPPKDAGGQWTPPQPRPPQLPASPPLSLRLSPHFDIPIITIFPPRHQEAALGHKPLPASSTLYPYPSERPLRSRRHSESVPETPDATITSMASPRLFQVAAMAALVFVIALSSAQAKPIAPGPAPAPAPGPTSNSDGTTLDQGIACVLMLLALVLTYLIHAPDVPAS